MTSEFELIIAKKYARAFINVFQDKLDLSIIENLEKFVSYINKNKRALFFMELTIVEPEAKKESFLKLFEQFNVDKTFKNLIDLLIKDKRITLLISTLNYIIDIYFEKSNILRFTISSSQELDQNQIDNILSYLKKETGKKIVYNTKIDKSLIAGIKLYSKTLGFEYSINKQLKAISKLC